MTALPQPCAVCGLRARPCQCKQRPKLDVCSTAQMIEWTRGHLGVGPLAGMFRRGGDIVFCPRVGENGYVPTTGDDRDDDGPAQVRPMNASQIASYVQLTYNCVKTVKDKEGRKFEVPAVFPPGAARPAFDHPDMQPGLRSLRGVTHTPLPRADGTILDVAGYDPTTRLLYLPERGLTVDPVPVNPTAEDVAAALKKLRYMIQDFRFLTIHDEANYLGMLLTPLLRELAPPPYKLGAIGAPQPGSGKSLLAASLRAVHGGVFRSEVPADDAEMRKAITTILDVTTGPVVQLDNVSGVLRSSVLAGLLTSATWEDRRLGSNSQMRGRNDRFWCLTGNNLTLGGDLVRRTLWSTIDPGVPNPHLRTVFTIPNLEVWVRDHRGELLHALLVLIRNWVVRGQRTTPRGSDSYATWIETVGGILAEAGHPGTFDHRDSARQTVGTDDDEWREFLDAVHGQFGDRSWTVKELLALFAPRTETDAAGFPRQIDGVLALDVLPAELAEKAARSHHGVGLIGKSLGRWLANRDGRWAGDRTVRRAASDSHAKQAMWKIHAIDRGGNDE